MEMREIDYWWDGPGSYYLEKGSDVHYLDWCNHVFDLARAVCALRDRGVDIEHAIIMRCVPLARRE